MKQIAYLCLSKGWGGLEMNQIRNAKAMQDRGHNVLVYSDSKYVVDAVEKNWVFGWVKKDFKDKKNKDLWLRYLKSHSRFKLKFVWVKGHAGHAENERCDELAVQAALQGPHSIDAFFENEAN